jgi:hypothetical protein
MDNEDFIKKCLVAHPYAIAHLTEDTNDFKKLIEFSF